MKVRKTLQHASEDIENRYPLVDIDVGTLVLLSPELEFAHAINYFDVSIPGHEELSYSVCFDQQTGVCRSAYPSRDDAVTDLMNSPDWDYPIYSKNYTEEEYIKSTKVTPSQYYQGYPFESGVTSVQYLSGQYN